MTKTTEAKLAWARQAAQIKAGKKVSMLTMLEQRGYINQVVGDRDELDQLMTEKRIGIYCGIDPTAASMHVGHLLPLMVLYWSYIYGFYACSLLGGATAQIGDPTDRTMEREVQMRVVRETNMVKIHHQLKSMWQHVDDTVGGYGYNLEQAWRRELANNSAWLNKLPVLELLTLAGKGVRIGPMLGRDTVKNRMMKGDGMSFAEFTYPLLQSWDWWHMYSTKDIQIQVGGSDQFGNILAGVDVINYVRRHHDDPDIRQDQALTDEEEFLRKPMGFTVPLLTTASGQKFGKSAGNAIWLDAEMTSAFDLYQFFLRMADADVHRYLKLFTFEPLENLEAIMAEHLQEPSKRVAQHKLAREVLLIVHGQSIANETEQRHRSLFEKSPSHVTESPSNIDKREALELGRRLKNSAPNLNAANAPSHNLTLPTSLVLDQPISRVLYHAGLVASRSEGHRIIAQKGAYLGSRPDASVTRGQQIDWTTAANWDASETVKHIIGGDTFIVRVGKWKIKVIKIISDESFEQQGFTAPGWKDGEVHDSIGLLHQPPDLDS